MTRNNAAAKRAARLESRATGVPYTKVRRAQEQQVIFDPVTGLPGKAAALTLLDHLLNGPDPGGVALVVSRHDDLARIKSSLGHGVFDELLVEVGARLQHELPASCTAAQLSTDEFVVLCPDVEQVGGPRALVQTVADLLRSTVTAQGRSVEVTASAGLAAQDVLPSVSGTGAVPAVLNLVRYAETALSAAAEGGHGAIAIAEPWNPGDVTRRLDMEPALRDAIENDGLRLEYQPVVGPDGTVLSAEALLRWSHPVYGEVTPGEFLPVAQRGGLQRELDICALRTAATEAASWPRFGQQIAVAVNLAGLLPADPDFLEVVTSTVSGSGLGWDQLMLELREIDLFALSQPALDAMSELVRRGVRFAVDDFGTGYSSLARLKQLPAQTVKIDRAFVTGVGTDPADFALTRAVVEVARAMGRGTVAEGVETADQFHVLRGLGVNAFQGWLFARSLRPDELHRILRRGSLPTPNTVTGRSDNGA